MVFLCRQRRIDGAPDVVCWWQRKRDDGMTGIRTATFLRPAAAFLLLAAVAALAPGQTGGVEQGAPATEPATQNAAAGKPIAPPSKADQFLTQDQLVEAYRQKQYLLVIREAGRILANPIRAPGYRRFNLLILRAESFLQTRNFTLAIEGFTAASEEAPSESKRAYVDATVTMIKERNGIEYHSWTTDDDGAPIYPAGFKGNRSVAISILDLGKRSAVFRAMLWDQDLETRRLISIVTAGKRIESVGAALKAVDELSRRETVARGGQEETDKVKSELASAIEEALSKKVADDSAVMAAMDRGVYTLTQRPRSVPFRDGRPGNAMLVQELNGLSRQGAGFLDEIIAFADRLGPTVDDTVRRLGVEKKLFEAVSKEAAANKATAQDMFRRYSDAGLLR
jgi:hypothetical protein